ncbi:OmpA family protein [Dawidia soli]|uniref:PD40 domain-containing protein n=1 Tax=Dawidia soli TaxID=2782352 RepID=A0AAP2D780_9BACT|nr:OmpA family protein [Dawidia soli]MBT1686402.1 PD40 domain-containing protein [Dawidia soli]
MVRSTVFLIACLSVRAFGQDLNFQTVQKLPATVNSEFEESMPLLAPDGKTLYFSRFMHPSNNGGKYSGTDVWVSTFDAAKRGWQKSDNDKVNFNNRGSQAVVGISAKGDVLYLLNTSSTKKVNGIYFSKLLSSGWTTPELIPIEGIDSQGFFSPYVSPDFDVIIFSMKGTDSRGQEDLYVSTKNANGQWSKLKNMGPTINTSGFEISPFLSADKKRLYFSSDGHSGKGDADVFYSDRMYDNWEIWSVPKNLGEPVNSKGFDAYFSLYGDSVAFFASNRDGKFSDIYRSSVNKQKSVVPGQQTATENAYQSASKTDSAKSKEVYLTSAEIQALLGLKLDTKIKFAPGSFHVEDKSRELLFFIANKVAARKDVALRLVGYSDGTGSEGYSLELARMRATSIRDFFISNGLEYHTIVSQGNADRHAGQTGLVEILFYKR